MQYVYSFKEGNRDKKNLLGGKGANLAEMSNLGLPIPDGFTVTTDACHEYYKNGKTISSDIQFQILSKLKTLEINTGKVFGDVRNPLLVSVRSGAPISMPGMMDSIMNLGMNDEVCEEMAKGNARMAYDSYRRFIEFYSEVVMNYPTELFAGYLEEYKNQKGYKSDLDLSSEDLRGIVIKYKDNYLEHGGSYFPQDPKIQLMNTISAVFASWNNDRAIKYRKLEGISDAIGTAVNVQEMVYGNMNDMSGTGVLFSRNPSTGEDKLTGEFLMNAQGEDIVSGIRTPSEIEKLKDLSEDIYNQLYHIAKKMENHYRDVQDMEFTIENGKLFILQTRIGKRTPEANVRFALDFLKEGLIDEKELIGLSASAEAYSNHPIAFALKRAVCGTKYEELRPDSCTEYPGEGITAFFGNETFSVGNKKLMERLQAEVQNDFHESYETILYTAKNGKFAGYISISDTIKEGAAETVSALKKLGISRTVMLTGDAEGAAAKIAEKLGVDEYKAGLFPADKVSELERLKESEQNGSVIFAGDGINDAPVLTRADAGIAMGALGSDAAVEAADVVLMNDDIRHVADSIIIARRTMRIVWENIVFALGVKAAVLTLGALGVTGMWAAVFADVGVALIAVLNAMRAIRVRGI